MTILVMAVGLSSLFLTVVSMIMATFALAKVYGMEKSTHKIIQGPWNQVDSKDETPKYLNADADDGSIEYDESIQDLPTGLKAPKPMTLEEQMKEHMYPDIRDEQV